MSRNAAGLPVSAIRVRALRGVFGISQAAAAARSGGLLTREEFAKLEAGANKATTYAAIEGLATTFGVQVQSAAGYMAGKVSLEELVRSSATSDEIAEAS